MDEMVEILNKIDDVLNCQRCELARSRTNVVVGDGPIDAEIMIIGEAPGRNEDKHGKPFVGSAGKILNEVLEKNGIKREKVYITNIVKCRPPKNRAPKAGEVEACHPYLKKQIEIISPKLIVLLGKTAGETFLDRSVSLGDEHGKIFEHNGIPVLLAYHPAAIIYNRKLKDSLIEDMKKVSELICSSL
ncbi:uracil-DNA glycosylase [Methanocella sp. CWC-04]|uniref:Type-4 uracil-DNA glycosylase n=1 Tax=Methanooceanicella nereidis TaxID=2052831 RepID=A0AAP2RFC4_9EURY|nr:uracil-DNA glycosylase [Methanocella sp. CWC-04]MCD1295791.1 uracil-DNA glycosylase [Methanocella sp. CWC-04]